jgi:hypothetical protein
LRVQDVALIACTRVTAIEIARARRINCFMRVTLKEFEGVRIHHWGFMAASHLVKKMLRKKLLKSIRDRSYMVLK